MFNPVPPRDEPPERPERGRRRYDDDEYPDISLPRGRRPPDETELSVADILLCVFCAGIGCIVGIVRASQGDPRGGKMIAISLLCAFCWTAIRLVLSSVR